MAKGARARAMWGSSGSAGQAMVSLLGQQVARVSQEQRMACRHGGGSDGKGQGHIFVILLEFFLGPALCWFAVELVQR